MTFSKKQYLDWSPPLSQVTSENVVSLWNPWVQLFACENAALIVNLNRFFSSPSPEIAEKLPSELAAEWNDFFLEGIYNLMLLLPISITGRWGRCCQCAPGTAVESLLDVPLRATG